MVLQIFDDNIKEWCHQGVSAIMGKKNKHRNKEHNVEQNKSIQEQAIEATQQELKQEEIPEPVLEAKNEAPPPPLGEVQLVPVTETKIPEPVVPVQETKVEEPPPATEVSQQAPPPPLGEVPPVQAPLVVAEVKTQLSDADIAEAIKLLAAKRAKEQALATGQKYDRLPNRLKKSKIEGPVKFVWALADYMIGLDPTVRRKDIIKAAIHHGVADYTARTQYQAWFTARRDSQAAAALAQAAQEAAKKAQ